MTERQGQKIRRSFSEDLKRKIVSEIEQGHLSPTEVSRCYQVQRSNIYRWIERYGSKAAETERLVLECDSDTRKAIALQARVAELERALGQKQLELEVQQKLLALLEEKTGIDAKKNFASSLSSPSESTLRSEDPRRQR